MTPFQSGDVDEPTFVRLARRQIEAGSHGVTAAGTTGEPMSLSPVERGRLFELAVHAVDGHGLVFAGTGGNELHETLRCTAAAHRAGASAALVVAPYFVLPGQEGLRCWFETIADAAALPIILYDIPGRTGVALTVDTTAALAAHPNITGVKLARPDLVHASAVIGACGPAFGVYSGVEALCYPMLAIGGAGHMSATANLFPTELARLVDVFDQGDHDAALAIHRLLSQVNAAVFLDTNPVPIKAMMEIAGLASAEVRPPLRTASPELRRTLADVLDAMTPETTTTTRGRHGNL